MNKEKLRFDPSIITLDGERYIEIKRDGLNRATTDDRQANEARTLYSRPGDDLLESLSRRCPRDTAYHQGVMVVYGT